MTRKEEREQAAYKCINCNAIAPECMQLAYGDFIKGAMWADTTAWKPSDEQMKILEKVCNTVALTKHGYEVLESLYNDLKKLTE